MLNKMNEIIKDIKELRGAEVKVFGQDTTLADGVDELTIDILDVLENLKEYVIDLNDYIDYRFDEEYWDDEEYCIFEDAEDADDVLDVLEYYGYITDVCDYKGDNSYNWSSPISNDFDIKIYKDMLGDGMFVEFKVHRFGDVRCNYTDSVILQFDNDYEFWEVLTECNKYHTIEVDGEEYDVRVDILSDGYEVCDIDGYIIATAYGDMDDIIEEIRENIELHA